MVLRFVQGYALLGFEKPGTARDAHCLEGWADREADGFVNKKGWRLGRFHCFDIWRSIVFGVSNPFQQIPALFIRQAEDIDHLRDVFRSRRRYYGEDILWLA